MRRILAGVGVLSLAALATTATATASPQDAGRTITICHATGSELNPYVPVTISADGSNGPNDHLGHVDDIIPPNDGSVLPGGRNLDKMDWWEAGCKDPGSSPDPVVVPVEPDPVVVPVEPDPVVVPVEPGPVVVVPVEPGPVVVVPVEPGPVGEVPLEPGPVGEVPLEPGPVGEVPLEPGDGNASPDPAGTPSPEAAPNGAVVAQGSPEAASGVAGGRNQGYSVQTAAAVAPLADPLMPGIAALLLSAAAVALRLIVRRAARHCTLT